MSKIDEIGNVIDGMKHDLKTNSFNISNVNTTISSSENIIKTSLENIIKTNNKISDSLDTVKNLIIEHDEKLNKRIDNLENDNKQLKDDNKQLNKKIDKITIKMLKDNLMICVNDLNEIYKLQKTEDKRFNIIMNELRKTRDCGSHYIRTKNDPDTEEMKQYKIKLIRDKLIEYSEYKDTFPSKLIDILNEKIKIDEYNLLDKDSKKIADDWWD